MITLALDTATPDLALALLTPEAEYVYCERLGRLHTQQIALHVPKLFEQAGLPFKAHRVVIGTGPGSYTGVRIAASYALGLAKAWGIAVDGASTLKAMAAPHEGLSAVLLDARRGNVYGALYQVVEGQISQTLIPEDKYEQAEFSARVQALGGTVHPEARVSALYLARLACSESDWKLSYL